MGASGRCTRGRERVDPIGRTRKCISHRPTAVVGRGAARYRHGHERARRKHRGTDQWVVRYDSRAVDGRVADEPERRGGRIHVGEILARDENAHEAVAERGERPYEELAAPAGKQRYQGRHRQELQGVHADNLPAPRTSSAAVKPDGWTHAIDSTIEHAKLTIFVFDKRYATSHRNVLHESFAPRRSDCRLSPQTAAA